MNIFANCGYKKTLAITMSRKGDDMAQYLLHWHNKQQVNLPTNKL
jgi:hypothetical protein